MPTIAILFGIVITMNYRPREHNPPHFHAEYRGHRASYLFDGTVDAGKPPPPQHKIVSGWARDHTSELEQAWEACRKHQNPGKVEP